MSFPSRRSSVASTVASRDDADLSGSLCGLGPTVQEGKHVKPVKRSFSSDIFHPRQGRKDSVASTDSAASGSSTWSFSSRRPHSPTANVYTYCGRYSDKFLFGDLSLTELVKSALRKKE